VPPVRDEESETQRKAHAKRVRETRRSTQGVTLEEIKVAEQLVKKKNQQQLHQATQQLSNHEQVQLNFSCLVSVSVIMVCFT
jgi:protein phosphatase 1 regulatory subunit 12A